MQQLQWRITLHNYVEQGQNSSVGRVSDRDSSAGRVSDRDSSVGGLSDRDTSVGRASDRDSLVGRESDRDRSIGRVSDWKARRNTDAGSIPRCGKRLVFPQSQLPVQTLTVSLQPPCEISHMHQHYVRIKKKSQTLAAIYHCFQHTKLLHTLRDG